jgi:hypothetical protein
MKKRTERQIRLAQNEAVFRAVNERIEAINEAFAVITETFDVVCECADPGCIKQIRVAIDTYERIRSDATLFIVARGHEVPDLEDTIEEHNDYSVVRKHPGLPQRVAEETDPRRPNRSAD